MLSFEDPVLPSSKNDKPPFRIQCCPDPISNDCIMNNLHPEGNPTHPLDAHEIEKWLKPTQISSDKNKRQLIRNATLSNPPLRRYGLHLVRLGHAPPWRFGPPCVESCQYRAARPGSKTPARVRQDCLLAQGLGASISEQVQRENETNIKSWHLPFLPFSATRLPVANSWPITHPLFRLQIGSWLNCALSPRFSKITVGFDNNSWPWEEVSVYGNIAVQAGRLSWRRLEQIKRMPSAQGNSMEGFTF